MRVTVQCFARLRDLAGHQEWACDVEAGATVADVWQQLARAFPPVGVMRGAVSCAVNADFASMDTVVRDGDEVAFLPPVSGGAPTES
jgi:molybdopterin converting factor subunit 1